MRMIDADKYVHGEYFNPWFEGRLRSLCNVYGYAIIIKNHAIEPYRTEIRIRKDTDLEYAHTVSMSIDPKDIPDGPGQSLSAFTDAVFKRLVNELDEEIKRDSKTPSQEVYCRCSSEANLTPKEYNKMFVKKVYPTYPEIKNVIFNPPATIVFWDDGTKTVVKAQNGEFFDPEKGLSMAIAKKHFDNKGHYFEEIKKWAEKYEESLLTADAVQKAVEEIMKEKGNYSAEYALFKELFLDPCIEYLSHLNDNPKGTDA